MNQFYKKNNKIRHSEFISESPQDSKLIAKVKEILNQVQDDVGLKYV